MGTGTKRVKNRSLNPTGYRVTVRGRFTWNIVRLYPDGSGGVTELEESLHVASPPVVDDELLGSAIGAYFIQYELIRVKCGSKGLVQTFTGSEVTAQTPTIFRADGVIKTAAEHDAENREDGAMLVQYLAKDPEQRLIRFAFDGNVSYVRWTDEDRLLPPAEQMTASTEDADTASGEEVVTIQAVRKTTLIIVFLYHSEGGDVSYAVQDAVFGRDEMRVTFPPKAFAFHFAYRVVLDEISPDQGRIYEEVEPTIASPLYYRADCREVTAEEVLRHQEDNADLRSFVGKGGRFVRVPPELSENDDKLCFRRLAEGDRVLSLGDEPRAAAFMATIEDAESGGGLGGMTN